MLKLAADENFNGEIYRRLKTQLPDLDIVRIQDTPLVGMVDEIMLEWVAQEGRLLLTHDEKSITPMFYERLNEGKVVPGIFMVRQQARADLVAEDVIMIVQITPYSEWADRITKLPL